MLGITFWLLLDDDSFDTLDRVEGVVFNRLVVVNFEVGDRVVTIRGVNGSNAFG